MVIDTANISPVNERSARVARVIKRVDYRFSTLRSIVVTDGPMAKPPTRPTKRVA